MQELRDIFQKIDFPHPSAGLGERIVLQIRAIEEQRRVRAVRITRIGRAFSFFAFAFTGVSFGQAIASSDFWQLASLLFSDAGIIAHSFGEFLLSLFETLPALPLSFLLAPLFSFLLFQYWSSRIGDPRSLIASSHITPLRTA